MYVVRSFTLNLCTGKSELQVYKQKVKHLLYEHQNSLTSLKADHEMWLKMQAEESSKRELDLQKDKRSLKQESKEQVILVPPATGVPFGSPPADHSLWDLALATLGLARSRLFCLISFYASTCHSRISSQSCLLNLQAEGRRCFGRLAERLLSSLSSSVHIVLRAAAAL